MSVQKLSPNYQEDTKRKLKNEGDCPAILFLIIDFVFLKMVQDLTQKLDAKFDGKKRKTCISTHITFNNCHVLFL